MNIDELTWIEKHSTTDHYTVYAGAFSFEGVVVEWPVKDDPEHGLLRMEDRKGPARDRIAIHPDSIIAMREKAAAVRVTTPPRKP